MIDKRYREEHPVQSFRALTLYRPNHTLHVSLIGLARVYPAIDMRCETPYPSGRIRTDYISLTPEEFMPLFDYLKEGLEHWRKQ